MNKIFLILKFFFIEIKLIKKTLEYFLNFLKEISVLKFLIYFFFNKSVYPFRDKNINRYLKINYAIWKNKKK